MRPPRRSKFALYLRSFLEKPTSPVNDTSLAKPSGKKLHQKKNSKLRSPSNARPPSDADARSAGNETPMKTLKKLQSGTARPYSSNKTSRCTNLCEKKPKNFYFSSSPLS
uniref:(northern house mosquito) hypothetical protein n=1 Tax=Culex pipiens TaxID=7175 RepID=A0A8D8G1Z3_CULPI